MSEFARPGAWSAAPAILKPAPRTAHRRRFARPRALLIIPALAVLAAAWLALAPPQLGGSTSYAITTGTSMLPNFRAGDLVLLRKESSYHVGMVAGYRNAMLGVV